MDDAVPVDGEFDANGPRDPLGNPFGISSAARVRDHDNELVAPESA
jgi:hypothetical protein